MGDNYEYIEEIKITRRNFENNTHSSIVDDSIKYIYAYKISSKKFLLNLFLYIITLGILYIISKFSNKIFLKLNCKRSDLSDYDYIVVIDTDNKYHIVKTLKENFFSKHKILYHLYNFFSRRNTSVKVSMENSKYKGFDYQNTADDALVFYYRHNKYLYNENEKYFESVRFNLIKYTNNEIYEFFGKGICDILDYNYLLNKFGLNALNLSTKSFFTIFLEQIIQPFYLYQVISMIIWIKSEYFNFLVLVLIMMTIMLIINTCQNYKNYIKIYHFANNIKTDIIRRLKDNMEGYSPGEKGINE
jgi:hypothetical protein